MKEGTLRAAAKGLEGAVRLVPAATRGVRLAWQVSHSKTTLWLGVLIVQGALPIAAVVLTRALVDSLVRAAGSGGSWANLGQPMLYALLMAAVLLLTEVLSALTRWVRTALAELVRDHISSLVHERAVAADLAFYESPEYFDLLHRIRWDVANRPMALLDNVGSIAQNCLTLIAMLAVLLRFGVVIPLALALSTLPALYVVLRYAVREYEWKQRVTADERKTHYYEWVLTSLENAQEVRLFALGDHFRERFRTLRARLRKERLALVKDQGLAGIAGGGFGLVILGGAMALMVWKAVSGAVSLGEVAMFYQAFSQGQKLMRSLLESAGQMYANTLFLGNLFQFLELKPEVVDRPQAAAPPALRQGVRLRDVTFAYPGAERPVLEGFNLEIPAGKVVAIVGSNGAGKTTLIKLLCRLYDPNRGAVELDGVDLRDLDSAELRRRITVLFQQPARFNATLAENVALGDIRTEGDRTRIEAAARAGGAHEAALSLPQGYDTLLGKWFKGGAELSVGEWQRVALARAFYRDAPLVLLDEPTSAMDSWAENEWMARFRELVRGKTALIITHRFTTAMRADLIHVMKDGQIVESGTHEELLRAGGLYAQSWYAQMAGAASGSVAAASRVADL